MFDIKIGGQLYADSIGDADSPAPTYLDMLKYNTDVIVAALSRTDDAPNEELPAESSGGNWMLWGVIGLLLVGGFVGMLKMQG